jgi:dihydrofolate reductase
MKLTTTTQVSVDGVMQGPGGHDEDRSDGFERGGWAMGLSDKKALTSVNEVYQRADAFLFGRRTYELFAGYLGREGRSRAPHRRCIEHAAQVRGIDALTEPQWADTTVLSSDVAAAIGELKAKPGGEPQVRRR